MERARWERAIGRHKKDELLKLGEDLGLREASSITEGKARSKKELTALIVDKCLEKKLPTSELLRLELLSKSSCLCSSSCGREV